jgi:hypothetical protein
MTPAHTTLEMKTIPLIIIIPKLQVQILCNLACQKALLIPYLPKNSQKINMHLHITATCPKHQRPFYGH